MIRNRETLRDAYTTCTKSPHRCVWQSPRLATTIETNYCLKRWALGFLRFGLSSNNCKHGLLWDIDRPDKSQLDLNVLGEGRRKILKQ